MNDFIIQIAKGKFPSDLDLQIYLENLCREENKLCSVSCPVYYHNNEGIVWDEENNGLGLPYECECKEDGKEMLTFLRNAY